MAFRTSRADEREVHRCSQPRRMCCRAAAAFVGMAAVLLAASCGSGKVSDRDIQFVDVEDASSVSAGRTGLLGMGERKAVWIDARAAAAHAKEHIPGSVNIPLGSLDEDDDARLDGFNIFIVYGGDYGDAIAAAMTKRLLALGYDDVRLLRGGLRAWKQAGQPTEGAEAQQ